MCKIFVLKLISKNRISHCSATIARQKTVFFENLFVIRFHLGAIENRKGHSENLQILTGKDFQIPAHADVKRHWISIVSNIEQVAFKDAVKHSDVQLMMVQYSFTVSILSGNLVK